MASKVLFTAASMPSGIPITMAEFFSPEVDDDQSAIVFGKADQPNMGQDDIDYFLVGAGRRDRNMCILREVYGIGADTGQEAIQHEGHEGGVVISGQLELTVGETVEVLNPGDGYYFECRRPHRFRNIGDCELVIVSANSPPNF